MDSNEKIRQLFDEYFKQPFQVIPAIVQAYNDTDKTVDCEPVDGSAEMFDVRIKATVGEAAGVEIIPVIGSKVLVAIIMNDDNAGFVVLYSAIEKVIIKPTVAIELNGNDLGGLVKINPLLTALNKLEDTIKNHQHISTSVGLQTTRDLLTNPDFDNTELDDVENANVKHG